MFAPLLKPFLLLEGLGDLTFVFASRVLEFLQESMGEVIGLFLINELNLMSKLVNFFETVGY